MEPPPSDQGRFGDPGRQRRVIRVPELPLVAQIRHLDDVERRIGFARNLARVHTITWAAARSQK